MQQLFSYIKPFSHRMYRGLTIKIMGTLAELLLPLILSHVLKNVVSKQDMGLILCWGLAMAICALMAFFLNTTANRMAAKVSRDISELIRSNLFSRILHLSAAQTDKFTIPSLESRITTDTYNVQNFIDRGQRIGVRAPIMLIGGLSITMFMDYHLAIIMLAVFPAILLVGLTISRLGIRLFTKTQRSADNMIGVVREDTQGIRVIKALSMVNYEQQRYDTVNRALSSDEQHANVIMGISNPAMTVFMNCGIVAVIALSAVRVSRGLSSPETVIAFMQYFSMISGALMSVTRLFVMYTKCAASARRIGEVLDAPTDLTVACAEQFPDKKSQAHIEFDDVCFSYLGKKDDLEHISFSLPRGGTLGIIGATGSGKSTLVKLLMRFYDVGSGAIYINGRDVRTFEHQERCAMFGCAMQNDFLYADTIEENIRFGRPLTHEQVVSAAITAQADEFISAFDDGYEHRLAQKGANLSGGQKQRLLIARAIAANPDILVLDDSSSALDYRTDAALRKALRERCTGTTVITVAQRVSSIKHCDLILVLDEGRVIGSGQHEELLAGCPKYEEISASQMGGALLD